MTSRKNHQLGGVLGEVERAQRRNAGLYAPSALRRAAEIAEALYQAGEAHGIERARWAWVTDIPAAAVDVVDNRDSIPQTPDGAVACLDAVVDALRERGVPAVRDELTVPVDRTDNTPPLGSDGRARLAVTISIDQGWGLTYSSPACPESNS